MLLGDEYIHNFVSRSARKTFTETTDITRRWILGASIEKKGCKSGSCPVLGLVLGMLNSEFLTGQS